MASHLSVLLALVYLALLNELDKMYSVKTTPSQHETFKQYPIQLGKNSKKLATMQLTLGHHTGFAGFVFVDFG